MPVSKKQAVSKESVANTEAQNTLGDSSCQPKDQLDPSVSEGNSKADNSTISSSTVQKERKLNRKLIVKPQSNTKTGLSSP